MYPQWRCWWRPGSPEALCFCVENEAMDSIQKMRQLIDTCRARRGFYIRDVPCYFLIRSIDNVVEDFVVFSRVSMDHECPEMFGKRSQSSLWGGLRAAHATIKIRGIRNLLNCCNSFLVNTVETLCRFTRYLVYSGRYAMVQINSSLLAMTNSLGYIYIYIYIYIYGYTSRKRLDILCRYVVTNKRCYNRGVRQNQQRGIHTRARARARTHTHTQITWGEYDNLRENWIFFTLKSKEQAGRVVVVAKIGHLSA